jgi:hypothetical protein
MMLCFNPQRMISMISQSAGLLIWHARKVPYAVFPGLAVGFAAGIILNLAGSW